jgi:hypothetical protein
VEVQVGEQPLLEGARDVLGHLIGRYRGDIGEI